MAVNKETEQRNRALIKSLLRSVVPLLVCICFLGVNQPLFAAIAGALSIYVGSTQTAPNVLSRICSHLLNSSKLPQAEMVARFGIAWCRLWRVDARGRLPRSIAWDAILIGHLAHSLLLQAKFDEAIVTYEKLLKLATDSGDITGVARFSGKLAFCYSAQGKVTLAMRTIQNTIPRLEAAIESAERNEEPGLVRVYRGQLCSARFEQATILETKRDYAAAEVIRRTAVAEATALYGPENLFLMPYLSMLGKVLIRLKKYDEAEQLLVRAYENRSKHLPQKHALIASSKLGLGHLYCETDRLDLASDMLTDALACVIDLVGEEAPDLPQFKWTLAKVRIKQGQYKEAETLLQSAIEQKVRNSSDMHPDLIEYLEAMAELKEATGLIDEASVAHRRAEAIQATLV